MLQKNEGNKKHKAHFIQFHQGSRKIGKTSWSFATPVGIFLLTQIPSEIRLAEEATDHKVYNAPWPCRTTFIIFLLDLSLSSSHKFHRFTVSPLKKVAGRCSPCGRFSLVVLITTKFMLDQTCPGKNDIIDVNPCEWGPSS